MVWTDERIETLRLLWEKGLTASQIAEKLGGVTRNAVIGKAHRLELQSRPSPVKSSDEQSVRTADRAAPKATGSPPVRPLAPKPVPPRVVSSAPAPDRPAVQNRPPSTSASATPVTNLEASAARADAPRMVSVGPGGFIRQGPGDQQAPIPPAPPRRRVPVKPSADIADKTSLLDLNERICRWPMGHPGEADFHFCGKPVNPGYPYCVEHCGRAFQAQLPRGTRRPPPPPPFGGTRVR